MSDNKNKKIDYSFRPKLFGTLKSYDFGDFTHDFIAGLIVAIIALPLSIALALCSGVEPQVGLYTAIAAGFIASLLGGCSVQISGPTAAFATIVAGVAARSGMDGLCVSTIIAGVFIIIFSLLKLGSYIKYMPHTIVVGFTAGVAVSILTGQLKDFFGVTFLNAEKPIENIEKLELFIHYFDTWNYQAFALGVICLLVIIFWTRVPVIGKKIPSSLIAVIVSSIAVKLLNLDIKTIGDLYVINSGLPSFIMPHLPQSVSAFLPFVKDAAIIAALASVESLLSAKVADDMTGDETYPNTELMAQGLANIASALFGGIPATGAIARTAANIKNGAKSPVAGMFHALFLALTLLFLIPYASLIPMPCIAAILFSVAYNMSGWRGFRDIILEGGSVKKRIADIIELVATFILTVVFDLVVAIIVGIALHLIFKFIGFLPREEKK